VCAPCAGIVSCVGFSDPKPEFPPVYMTTDENALLPNASNKENDKEPTSVVLEEVP
jgi:hypothetical protein